MQHLLFHTILIQQTHTLCKFRKFFGTSSCQGTFFFFLMHIQFALPGSATCATTKTTTKMPIFSVFYTPLPFNKINP